MTRGSWEWAVEMYSETSMKAVDIARELGISGPLLSYRMNRAGVAKRGRERIVQVKMFRCPECSSLSLTNTCPNGHIVNPYLANA